MVYFLGAPVLLYQGSLWASDPSDVPVTGWSFCDSYFLLLLFCRVLSHEHKMTERTHVHCMMKSYSHTKFL